IAGTTVVVHEQLERNPGGVWVGYADGHLDFASSAQDLAACKEQLQIIRATIAKFGDPLTDKLSAPVPQKGARGKPTDTLKIKILDPEGQPVRDAWVGLYARFGDRHTPDERVIFPGKVKDAPAISDGNGEATVPFVFDAEMSRFSDEPVAPLYILHEQRQLV